MESVDQALRSNSGEVLSIYANIRKRRVHLRQSMEMPDRRRPIKRAAIA